MLATSFVRSSLVRPTARLLSPRLAAFSTSSPQKFITFPGGKPQPPGYIVGTVNDATPIPAVERSHGSYHWAVEKAVAVSILPLTVIPFATGSLSPTVDAILGSLLVIHAHIGFESCIIDYIPKRVYGYHKYLIATLYAGSAVALYGVYQLEVNDVGLTATLSKIWHA